MITYCMATKADLARRAAYALMMYQVPIAATATIGQVIGNAVDYAATALKGQGFTVPRSLSDDVKAGAEAVCRMGSYGSADALRRYAELWEG